YLARIDAVEAPRLFPFANRGDDFARHGSRLISGADDIDNADRRENRTPAHRGAIDAGEEIARKQRAQHRLMASRVTDARAIARQIGRITLPQEVLKRLGLVMRPRVDGVPAHHGVASSTGCRVLDEMRNRLGARTQPAGWPLSSVADNRR